MEIKIRRPVIIFYFSVMVLIFYSMFLKGYFPIKRGLHGFTQTSEVPAVPEKTSTNKLSVPARQYDRLVLMVIDALRGDFVFDMQNGSTPMPFLSSLIGRERALPFLAKVHPPTVTLPRIKAITTGDIPGFIDVVLNFGSSHLQDDNLITQFKLANRTQIFFGDDTWINLFPDHFLRYDGTSSFFVTDYTEVDNNVTRHLSSELVSPDWDVMILHYLGLDHIGHLSGPKSPLIAPKLVEMDAIIKTIFSSMEEWSSKESDKSLLLICGDHGMSNQGGHGGASLEETMVPVILASPSFTPEATSTKINSPKNIFQIDLAPTLAMLMGVPIPKNSLGQIVLESLIGYSVEDQLRAYQINAFQILNILQQNIQNYERDEGYQIYLQTEKQHGRWLDSMRTELSKESWEIFGQKLCADYQRSVQLMASRISRTATTYDLYSMITAIVFLISIFLLLCIMISSPMTFLCRFSFTDVAAFSICCSLGVIGHVTVCTSLNKSDLLCQSNALSFGLQLLMMCMFCSILILFISYKKYYRPILRFIMPGNIEMFFLIGTLLHTLSLLSSSFVEEEHQTWYFYTTTVHVMILIKVLYKKGTESNKTISQDKDSSCKNQPHNTESENNPLGKYMHHESSEDLCNYNQQEHSASTDSTIVYEDLKESENAEGKCFSKKNYKTGRAILSGCLLLVLLRVLRAWNQTGDKWRHLPDVGDWLVRPENKDILSGIVVFSIICIIATRCFHRSPFHTALFVWAMICIYCFRAANGSVIFPSIYSGTSKGTLEAQVCYAMMIFLMMETLVTWIYFSIRQQQDKPNSGVILWERIQTIWLTLGVLLSRPHNIAVVAMISVFENLVFKHFIIHIKQLVFLLLYCAWMGEATFFFQGNSNSITTVDVTAGYVGLVDYQPVLIGLLMFSSTYFGPVFWFLSFFKYTNHLLTGQNITSYKTRLKSCYANSSLTLLLVHTPILLVFTILVTIERYHLFAWTVFSPKLLYEGTKTIVIVIFSWIFLFASYVI